ncbi:unnamed protein product [Vicia faba]|uniref:RNase H type-1 domain-containing protein n=1 Tax=Vicia faba TaxID=3906 RepID=A0AAV0ZKC5_VICFA|nr:unnamed protein product [Vicia faba]
MLNTIQPTYHLKLSPLGMMTRVIIKAVTKYRDVKWITPFWIFLRIDVDDRSLDHLGTIGFRSLKEPCWLLNFWFCGIAYSLICLELIGIANGLNFAWKPSHKSFVIEYDSKSAGELIGVGDQLCHSYAP